MIANKWSGKAGFIMASAGAAVGLGNIWRLPYLIYEGGSVFVVFYILFVLILALPLLISEIMLGRHANADLISGLKKIATDNSYSAYCSLAGWFSLSTLLVILSFYSVISGWVIYYLESTVFDLILGESLTGQDRWSGLMKDYKKQFLYHAVFMFITMSVTAKGINRGLEKLNKVLMPCLFLLLIFLALYAALTTKHSLTTAKFLFNFDMGKVTSRIILESLGQALFSLAAGGGAMFVYGSYLPRRVSIVGSSFYIAILQLIVGALIVFAIFPIVFAKDMYLESGPGLIFAVIPAALSGMALSNLVICLFFILLLFAAITSSVNLAEPLVSTFVPKVFTKRSTASVVIGIMTLLLGLPSILSFNLWKSCVVLGNYTIFEAITHVSTNVMLPLGCITYALYSTWILPKKDSKKELFTYNFYYHLWRISAKYLIPISLITILLY